LLYDVHKVNLSKDKHPFIFSVLALTNCTHRFWNCTLRSAT